MWLIFNHTKPLPGICLLCRSSTHGDQDLCPPCARDLPWNRNPCPCCGAVRPLHVPRDRLCGSCLRRSPPWDATISPLQYAWPVDELVLEAKFRRNFAACRLLGQVLATAVARAGSPLPQAVVPVPLHGKRFSERGFNQALEIARPISKAFQLRVLPNLCRRVRPTLVQSSLPARRRRTNVRGAFRLSGQAVPEHVALLDDVVTTGSTIGELTRLLRCGGARRVDVWSAARA